jgi:tetratricopeptide (TPR) repeat protein
VSAAAATDPYVGYRDALRGGHLAALRGAHEPAIRAYREAARLLPDRAAPYVALGRAQLAVGRPQEALASFEAALSRAPRNTAALDGAARALLELERADDAADVLDGLAAVYAEADRPTDALGTVERATEISGSPWRRAMLEQLHGEEPQLGMDLPWLADVSERARPYVFGHAVTDELRDLAERVEVASASDDVTGLVAGARALARADRLRAAVDACHDALTVAPADPEVHRTLAAIYRRQGRERAARTKLRIVERHQDLADDPEKLDRDAEHALVTGDLDELLRIVRLHAGQGRTATALDLLFAALGSAPGEPRLHLAIARLHVRMGRRRRAVAELERLARLVDLTGDTRSHDAISDFVNAALTPAARRAAPAD